MTTRRGWFSARCGSENGRVRDALNDGADNMGHVTVGAAWDNGRVRDAFADRADNT